MRVEDILEAIGRISRYTAGMDEAAFSADEKPGDAVVRNMTVIGEATWHISANLEARYAHIPWDEICGFRNVVVHEIPRLQYGYLVADGASQFTSALS